MNDPISIRRSTDQDQAAILELAALDGHQAPAGEALLAFIGTELRAALPLDGGEPIADPFHRTADLVELLRLRAAGLAQSSRGRRPIRLAALRPRPA